MFFKAHVIFIVILSIVLPTAAMEQPPDANYFGDMLAFATGGMPEVVQIGEDPTVTPLHRSAARGDMVQPPQPRIERSIISSVAAAILLFFTSLYPSVQSYK